MRTSKERKPKKKQKVTLKKISKPAPVKKTRTVKKEKPIAKRKYVRKAVKDLSEKINRHAKKLTTAHKNDSALSTSMPVFDAKSMATKAKPLTNKQTVSYDTQDIKDSMYRDLVVNATLKAIQSMQSEEYAKHTKELRDMQDQIKALAIPPVGVQQMCTIRVRNTSEKSETIRLFDQHFAHPEIFINTISDVVRYTDILDKIKQVTINISSIMCTLICTADKNFKGNFKISVYNRDITGGVGMQEEYLTRQPHQMDENMHHTAVDYFIDSMSAIEFVLPAGTSMDFIFFFTYYQPQLQALELKSKMLSAIILNNIELTRLNNPTVETLYKVGFTEAEIKEHGLEAKWWEIGKRR